MRYCNVRRFVLLRQAELNQGLTLMESLVVVAMLGILSTIAAPNFLNWQTQYQITQAAEQVKSALEISQQEAIRRSQICTLDIPDGSRVSGDCLATGTVNFAPGIALKSNLIDDRVRFGLRGNTTDGGTILIYANGSSQRAKCIVTSLGIGMIRTGDYVGNINESKPNQCQPNS